MQNLFYLLLALLAGAVLPVQSGLNAQIGRQLGHPVLAVLVSVLVSAAALLGYVAVGRLPLPPGAALRGLPAWVVLPGLFGVLYITAVVVLVPRLGSVLTFALVIGGQLLVSLLLDHYGLLGLATRPLTLGRVLGVVLLVLGIAVIRRF